MTSIRRPAAATLLLALMLAACGGGAATTAPDDSPEPTTASEPSSDVPSQAPEETPAESQGGGGGGGGTDADACELTSAEDIGGVMGQDVTVSMNTPGDVSFCIFNDAAGSAIVATSLMRRGGSGAFDLWKAGAGVQQVDGLGDDAVFDPSSATLLVLRGDSIFSVTAGDGSQPEAQRIDWSKAIAEIALGRM